MECERIFTNLKIPPQGETDPLVKHSSSRGDGSPDVWGVYEPDTGSIQYIAVDPKTRDAVLIDVVLNFDPSSGRVSTEMADTILALCEKEGLKIDRILDTHPHADHFMASHYLHCRTGAATGIGEGVKQIAELWRGYYNLDRGFSVEDNFTHLFRDGETFDIGALTARVVLTPGHTPASIAYHIGDAAFVHDTFMYPDSGTARADFPGGSVDDLWESLQRILSFDPETRLFIGHDYCSQERDTPCWEASVSEQRAHNVHLKDKDEKQFKELRTERDKTLGLPLRILAALQVNLRGGRLPEPETDGERYLKIPLNRF